MGHATHGELTRADWRNLLRRRVRFALVALLALCDFLPSQLLAQQARPSEYRVKAVYLYNFGKFAQWPADKSGSFGICVLGEDPFGPVLSEIVKGETINGQALTARHVDRAEDTQKDCRIVFISSSEQDRLSKILDLLQTQPVLTVSDMPAFCDRGGMIQFVIQGDKVRFQVNIAPATKAGLMLSSQLLKVATSVTGNNPGGK